MAPKFKRDCPICHKPELLYLSDHLSQVHQLSSEERKPWLKAAVFSNAKTFPFMIPLPFWSLQQQTTGLNSPLTQQQTQTQSSTPRKFKKPSERVPNTCLETRPYPDFKFNHMFSMLVVGPSQCGKTHFVEKILTENCIHYPNKKKKHIYWFYNQWQPCYTSMQSALGDEIQFSQGLPDLSDDLHEINPKLNNILVFDDLMAQATDSPVLSKLFTQGRHRNASVILLLQNMFPKGKFNRNISRNAQYLTLFRSPGDRKQINIIAERIFAKDRPNFMTVYGKVTAKPYGYLLIDNQPKTPSEKQVVSDVFGQCLRYPHISTQIVEDVTQGTPKTNEPLTPTEQKEQVQRKIDLEKPHAKKQGKRTPNPIENQRESAIPQPKKKQQQQKTTWTEFNPAPKKKKRSHATTFTYDRELNDNSYHLYDI